MKGVLATLAVLALLYKGNKTKKVKPTILGHLEIPPQDDDDVVDPYQVLAKVFDDLTTQEPTPGHLYQVRKGDNLSKLVARALGRSSGTYARAMAGAAYNAWQYGVEPSSSQTTGIAIVDGRSISIGPAFLPSNPNVRVTLNVSGQIKRYVRYRRSASGRLRWATRGAFYGALWCPPLLDGQPHVWPWNAPESSPAPLLAAMDLDPLALPKPWSL